MTATFTHPRHVAKRHPDRAAVVMAGGESLSYAELVRRADQTAQLFRALGVGPGETVAFLIENSVRMAELCWAAKNSGLYYVCIATHLTANEVAYIIDNSEARLIVTSRKLAELVEGIDPAIAQVSIDGDAGRARDYAAALAEQPATPIPGARRGASMLYSSGTTGRPKGVRMAIEDVAPEAPPRRQAMLVDAFGFGPGMVFVNPAPLYHVAPLRMMMAVQRLGGTAIIFPRFEPEAVLDAIDRYRATHASLVPIMFVRLLRLPESVRARYSLGSLRVVVHSAAPCPADVKRRMLQWWGPVIHEIYGGTEGIGHTIIGPQEWLAHPGSVGRCPPGCEIEIRDATGQSLPPGETGRIFFRNAARFSYFKDAGKTTEAVCPDGFATYGDIGRIDRDGYLFLTDRASHMIISGGVNIYPQETEEVLLCHPGISDAAVIGIPDAEYGERVKAIVEPFAMPADAQSLAAEITAFCRTRLSPIKCPRAIEFVESLPRNELGKIAKHVLRDRYARSADATSG
ncbi:AMP-binding protein [Sphingomonas sp.]|uniref:AMP-binding protein n=1 Tax=Sphingomonas sp. TaxID=28214 RepID=UPI001ED16D3E|nr:AMP-binding protein [Sphingomonas sp.]MBX3595041.1 AMP-binding protein [Sphingomonas sp.]